MNQSGQIPQPRSHFGSALVKNQFIIFGGSGSGEGEKLNDIYSLDLSMELFFYLKFII